MLCWYVIVLPELNTSNFYDAERKKAKEEGDIRVISVDLQEMAEIEGVAILQGDISFLVS